MEGAILTTALELPNWARPDTDLTGKTVLVVGGAGGVGEGITRAMLRAGATVVATARAESKLEDLAARVGHANLSTRRLELTADVLVPSVAATVKQHGPLDGIVLAVADWGRGARKRIMNVTDAEWHEVIERNQTSRFRAFRALVPTLAPAGAIVDVNGLSADIPFPDNGVGALTSAANKSMTRTLAEELRGEGPRVYELVLGVIRTRPRQLAGIDNEDWVPAIDVGTHTAELVAGNSPLADSVLQYFVTREAGPSRTAPDTL